MQLSVENDIREIRRDVKGLVEHTSEMIGHFEAHTRNYAIHQIPPCEAHKLLSARLWALAAGVVAAVAGSAYTLIKGQ